MIVASLPPLVCIDPGHGTPPAIGRQAEPIGPGSGVLKIKDGGGAAGEAVVNLAIAKKTRTLLLARGYRVAMTRTGPVFRYGNGGTTQVPEPSQAATLGFGIFGLGVLALLARRRRMTI